VEVCGGGAYYQWRKGRGKNRVSKYGGTFHNLPDERKEAYQKNREIFAERRARNTPANNSNVPRGGDSIASREHGAGGSDNAPERGSFEWLVSTT